MTRARACIASALFLLGVIVSLAVSSAVFSQTLPTNWEVRYLNIKDSLRALAVDPLDPRIVFIGSDQEIRGSLDGGETWTVGESFRTASFGVTGAVSAEAVEVLLMIEEDEEAIRRDDDLDLDQLALVDEELAEAVREAEARLADPEQELARLRERETGLTTELQQAEEAAEQARAARAEREVALDLWEPDDVTVSEVDAMTIDEAGRMEDDDYAQIGVWLSERGLTVPTDAQDRKDTLIDYLQDHAREGETLTAALAEASAAADAAAARAVEAGESLAAIEASITEVEAEVAERAAAVDAAEEELEVAVVSDEELDIFEQEAVEDVLLDINLTGVNRLAFDPAASGKIYAGAFDGVYRSEDSGDTWRRIYTGPNPPQSAILSLAVDPSDPDVIFAGTFSGLARSSDGGETWDRPAGRIAAMVVSRIAVHPFDSRIVLAGTIGHGIFKSTDGGGEWTQVMTRAAAGANQILALEFAPSQPEVIYTGTMSGIYKSLDGGESWELATGLGISASIQVRDLVISPINPDLVVIAAERGIFGTADGGGAWRRLAFGTMFEGARELSFDPLDPNRIWLLTNSRVFESAPPPYFDLSVSDQTVISSCSDFTLDGRERHSISIVDIDEETGEVTLTVRSEPRTVRIKVGESASLDLTGDGRDDMTLTLESLEAGVPLFSMLRIALDPEEEDPDYLPPPELITCLEDMEPYFRDEPTWVEVQQAAARWAEVHPEKIAQWRSGASFRALLPRVGLDFVEQSRRREDFDHDTQYSFTRQLSDRDWYQTDTQVDERTEFRSQYRIFATDSVFQEDRRDSESIRDRDRSVYQDRVLERHRSQIRDTEFIQLRNDRNWGVYLRWDLGDFLFTIDQIRIATEARRLVELRQDVVEQVTLYYFDRRTARIDMILNPPADPYSQVEMLLQIQQLDASLDAMTGGFFTQAIRDREMRRRR